MSGTRHRVSLTAFAMGALSILLAFGVWQLERRAWKNDLISRFEQALSRTPSLYEPARPNAAEAREFMRVSLKGEFQDSQTVKMLIPTPLAARARTQDGFGYLLFTPLKFEKGVVFVNRGFVPQGLADDRALFREGEVTITGIVRRSETPGWFTPPPEPAKRLFFAADIPAMATAAGAQADRVVADEYIEAETAANATEWPMGRDPRDLLTAIPNRHLEYALTWFGLAVALAGVYGLSISRA